MAMVWAFLGDGSVGNIGGAVDCGGKCDMMRTRQDSWGYGGISSAVLGSAAAAAGVEVVARLSWWGCLCGAWCVTEADHILTQPEGTKKKSNKIDSR